MEIKVEVGTASQAEEVQAQSGLAQRKLARLEAQRERTRQDLALKDLVIEDLTAASLPFTPIDEPVTNRVIGSEIEVLSEALRRRPEMEKSVFEVANAEDAFAARRG